MDALKYRHEWKHEINALDRLVLLARLSAVMKPDPHAVNGSYRIRSLYFDTPEDKALREKIDGVNAREKFRIRYYNQDTSFLVLEKKSKLGACAPRRAAACPPRRRRESWMAISAGSCPRTGPCAGSCTPK